MKLLSYDKYREMDGELSQTAYSRLYCRAEQSIQAYTFGRIDFMSEIPDTIKFLIFDLIELYSKNATPEMSSYSNDGVSISYNAFTPDTIESSVNNIIRSYLLDVKTDDGTPLLYCGV